MKTIVSLLLLSGMTFSINCLKSDEYLKQQLAQNNIKQRYSQVSAPRHTAAHENAVNEDHSQTEQTHNAESRDDNHNTPFKNNAQIVSLESFEFQDLYFDCLDNAEQMVQQENQDIDAKEEYELTTVKTYECMSDLYCSEQSEEQEQDWESAKKFGECAIPIVTADVGPDSYDEILGECLDTLCA